jgi:hypothetical protein
MSGDLYLTHTKLNGKLTLRLCIGADPHASAARGERVAKNRGRSGERSVIVMALLNPIC